MFGNHFKSLEATFNCTDTAAFAVIHVDAGHGLIFHDNRCVWTHHPAQHAVLAVLFCPHGTNRTPATGYIIFRRARFTDHTHRELIACPVIEV